MRLVYRLLPALLGASVACSGGSTTGPGAEPPEARPTATGSRYRLEPKWRALVMPSTRVALTYRQRPILQMAPRLYDTSWQARDVVNGDVRKDRDAYGKIAAPGGAEVAVHLKWEDSTDGAKFAYTLTPDRDVELNSLHVAFELPIDLVKEREVTLDGEVVKVPATLSEEIHLASREARRIGLSLPDQRELTIELEQPAQVVVQDNRRWGPTLVIRVGNDKGPTWKGGEPHRVAFAIQAPEDIGVQWDQPVRIVENEEWLPLALDLEIEPGSALDFSGQRPTGAPAGKDGRLVIAKGGHFVFENARETPLRFYGVNLSFSAQYLTHEQADRLAVRLARLGYNTLRIHHYEGELTEPEGFDAPPEKRKPTSTRKLDTFSAPGHGDYYVSRIRALLSPPKTGKYVFYIASDNDAQLWFSSSDSPDAGRKIASVEGWTSRNEFDKYRSQRSKPLELRAGKRYYIKAVHKENDGGDHLSVAWSGPGIDQQVIDGKHLGAFPRGQSGYVQQEIWKTPKRVDSLTMNPEKLDQLDYLVAALKKQGIYVTTDLFVSRPVLASEIWPEAEGKVAMNDFKMAVLVNERAWRNWKAFSKKLLTHRNPYTGRRWADEPAIGWLSMINEGNPTNFIGSMGKRVRADWRREWNQWLAKEYGAQRKLEAAWKTKPQGSLAEKTIALPDSSKEDTQQVRDLLAFVAGLELEVFERMKRFLRREVGTKALLTNRNGWTSRLIGQAARVPFDYVDDHFYVDHPRWVDKKWNLPSRLSNRSPVAAGAPGGCSNAFVRLWGKPFTISEYNYSGPGRYRGVGGILSGALAAIQGWGSVWRFAYSHNRDNLFTPSSAGYFDLVSDPLNQAAERAALLLYLRGDMQTAPHRVAIAATQAELLEARSENHPVAPSWSALAWLTGVGTHVPDQPGTVPADVALPLAWTTQRNHWKADHVLSADPYSEQAAAEALQVFKKQGWLSAEAAEAVDRDKKRLRSETGELTIDGERDMMVLNTPKTAGGYAREGQVIETAPVRIHIQETDATVWVSSIDDRPIERSRRLLITHLTDLQNSEVRYGERARETLLDWGGLPHLVRTGRAQVHIRMSGADKAKVYSLSTSGERLSAVPAKIESGSLVVSAEVRGDHGARLLYEVVVE